MNTITHKSHCCQTGNRATSYFFGEPPFTCLALYNGASIINKVGIPQTFECNISSRFMFVFPNNLSYIEQILMGPVRNYKRAIFVIKSEICQKVCDILLMLNQNIPFAEA